MGSLSEMGRIPLHPVPLWRIFTKWNDRFQNSHQRRWMAGMGSRSDPSDWGPQGEIRLPAIESWIVAVLL